MKSEMSAKSKKLRRGKAVKKDGKRAEFVAGPAAQPLTQFDPSEVLERINLWWLNGSKKYFRPTPNGIDWISIGEQDAKRALRLAGVLAQAPKGQSCSQADWVMQYIQNFRHVDFVGPLAGWKAGVHLIHDRRIIVLGSYKLVEPVENSDWPTLRALLEGMLKTANFDQLPYLYSWLKVAITALRAGERRAGHALILVGPTDSHKSFLQEHVVTPLLGGRIGIPTAYLLGKTIFNSELLGSEHLMISELPTGLDHKSRAFLGEQLKNIVATEGQSYHPKHCDAVTMYPFWRVTISVNSNPNRIKSLPPIGSDIADKLLLLRAEFNPNREFRPRSDEERRAFRETLSEELPSFVHFLLNYEIPGALLTGDSSGRFGFSAFQHPQIIADMFAQEPASGLLYMIDNWIFNRDKNPSWEAWGWKGELKLKEELTAEGCPYAAQASKLLYFDGAAGTYLAALMDLFPERIEKKHTKSNNVWMIRSPQ